MGVFRQILLWLGIVCMALAACGGFYLYETWPTMPQAVVDADKALAERAAQIDAKLQAALAPGSTDPSELASMMRAAREREAARGGTATTSELSASELAARARAARDRRLAADVDPQIEALRTDYRRSRRQAEVQAAAAAGVGMAGAGFFVAGAVPWRRMFVGAAESMIRMGSRWWERARPLLDYPRLWTVIYRACVVVLLCMVVQAVNREQDVYVSGGRLDVEVENTVDVSGSVDVNNTVSVSGSVEVDNTVDVTGSVEATIVR